MKIHIPANTCAINEYGIPTWINYDYTTEATETNNRYTFRFAGRYYRVNKEDATVVQSDVEDA